MIDHDYIRIDDQQAHDRALALARGRYQSALLRGEARLSGAELQGKARRYGGRYRDSRRALLRRMTAAGIAWHEERGEHGKRVLVIG